MWEAHISHAVCHRRVRAAPICCQRPWCGRLLAAHTVRRPLVAILVVKGVGRWRWLFPSYVPFCSVNIV